MGLQCQRQQHKAGRGVQPDSDLEINTATLETSHIIQARLTHLGHIGSGLEQSKASYNLTPAHRPRTTHQHASFGSEMEQHLHLAVTQLTGCPQLVLSSQER